MTITKAVRVLLPTLAFLAIVAWAPSSARGQAREIQVKAKKYQFNPNVITVKQGEQVKLVITATDRDHGFKCDAFGINQKLKKGAPATVEFTANKVGTFPFHCSDFCGMGHLKMKGKIVVEKSSSP